MEVTSAFLQTALLQHNYLPNQNRQQEELPPILSSTSFSQPVARELAALPTRSSPSPGYDSISYTLTRFNNVPRVLSIPHPKPHADLSLCIVDNWARLEHITDNQNSILHLSEHADGRVFIMNYTGSIEQGQQEIELSVGKQFIVQSDIANFYPSIYSHAIPWALVGHKESKRTHRKSKLWYNKLDTAITASKRNETHGVPVGPATSNIIADLILYRVDESLSGKYIFRRFNDDYMAYCETESEAAAFVLDLALALEKYSLYLNSGKTKVEPLPRPIDASWKFDLLSAKPEGDSISGYEATRYLSFAVHLSHIFPEASVLKYALKTLKPSELSEESCQNVLMYGLNLSVHQPVLLPALKKLMSDERTDVTSRSETLQTVLAAHITARRTDGISWTLYYFLKHGITISASLARKVIESRECIPILLLYETGARGTREAVVDFAKSLDFDNCYELDQYWMLLYQLYLDGQLSSPYRDDRAFEVMKEHGVSFVETMTDRGA